MDQVYTYDSLPGKTFRLLLYRYLGAEYRKGRDRIYERYHSRLLKGQGPFLALQGAFKDAGYTDSLNLTNQAIEAIKIAKHEIERQKGFLQPKGKISG